MTRVLWQGSRVTGSSGQGPVAGVQWPGPSGQVRWPGPSGQGLVATVGQVVSVPKVARVQWFVSSCLGRWSWAWRGWGGLIGLGIIDAG
jgi:hypothetical protein